MKTLGPYLVYALASWAVGHWLAAPDNPVFITPALTGLAWLDQAITGAFVLALPLLGVGLLVWFFAAVGKIADWPFR